MYVAILRIFIFCFSLYKWSATNVTLLLQHSSSLSLKIDIFAPSRASIIKRNKWGNWEVPERIKNKSANFFHESKIDGIINKYYKEAEIIIVILLFLNNGVYKQMDWFWNYYNSEISISFECITSINTNIV